MAALPDNTPTWLDGMDDAFRRLAALHPKYIDLSLGRMERVLSALGNPEERLPPVIHIAGTNGKGSTLAFLKSLMESQNKTCHVYTSPHLVRFNERIVVAGQEVSNETMTAAAEEVEAANQNQPLTFFEAMTATAFLIFSRTRAHFCLLETGLGGRLDATNVIKKPTATLISSIDYDHQAFLGDTLTEIASEKAGIIKPHAPVFVAPQEAEVLALLKKVAERQSAPLYHSDRDWRVEKTSTGFVYENGDMRFPLPQLGLAGHHQLENAALALSLAKSLNLLPNETKACKALAQCQWRARLQKLSYQGREIILDGGHNAEAGRVLGDFLSNQQEPCYLICAMRATKAAEQFLSHFKDRLAGLYALDLPFSAAVPGEGAKGYQASELEKLAKQQGISAQTSTSLDDALKAIPREPAPLILVAGSLLLAGDVLARVEGN